MDPTSKIRKLGFRRWYERELIKSHAALVTMLLCGVLISVLVEQLNVREFGWRPLSALAVMFAAGALGWFSWRSYITTLHRAEFYGERSTCPKCQAYGRFNVVATGMDAVPGRTAEAVAPLETAWMRVECRMCGTGWRIPE